MPPLHVAQAACLQVLNGVVRRVHPQRLIGGELLGRHPGLLWGAEERRHTATLFRELDLLVGGEQAIKDAAHLVVEIYAQQVPSPAVDVEQPGAEALKESLQLDTGGLAFE